MENGQRSGEKSGNFEVEDGGMVVYGETSYHIFPLKSVYSQYLKVEDHTKSKFSGLRKFNFK